MGLINRLIGQNMTPEERELGKLPVHQAIAAWGEHVAGEPPYDDYDELCLRFGITAEEKAQLSAWMLAHGAGYFSLAELEHVLELGEAGGPEGPFLTEAEVRTRLGV